MLIGLFFFRNGAYERRNKMKKLLAILLSLSACAACLTACGDGRSEVSDSGFVEDSRESDSMTYDDDSSSGLTDRVKDDAKDVVSGGADIVDDAASTVGDVAKEGADLVGDTASNIGDTVSRVLD